MHYFQRQLHGQCLASLMLLNASHPHERKTWCLESFHKATSFLITCFLSQSLIKKAIYWESCDRVTLVSTRLPLTCCSWAEANTVDFCSDSPPVVNKGSQTVLVQSHSHIRLFAIPWTAACQAVPHHLLEFAQVHVHCIGIATQPSHPLTPSSPSALNPSQHQGLFQWLSCSHHMIKILALQLRHQSFQGIFRVDLLAVQRTLRSIL